MKTYLLATFAALALSLFAQAGAPNAPVTPNKPVTPNVPVKPVCVKPINGKLINTKNRYTNNKNKYTNNKNNKNVQKTNLQ